MTSFAAVILAAGKGMRMLSDLPKALQPLCGEPLLSYVLGTVEALGAKKIVVVAGYKFDRVREAVGRRAQLVRQKQLLGSGHAVAQAEAALAGFKGPVLVMYCDTPLVSAATVGRLADNHRERATDCTLLSVEAERPAGYGRIKRNPDGSVARIVEETDADAVEKKIREINVGCYVFNKEGLFAALKVVRRNPNKKEYYLTDVVEILSRTGRVEAVRTADADEVAGVNTRLELAVLEERAQQRILQRWIARGVRIRDPRSTTIDAGVEIGHDTVIFPHTVIEQGSKIGKNCQIGPFARIRGASRIEDGAVIGNFVEIVRSRIGRGTQVKHLSYIGDAEIGAGVNVGAGTITANYDGKKKHKTVIKDKAQIGSGTVLVAPVIIGRSAKTGAGSVVTKGKNVPDRGIVVGVPAKRLSVNSKAMTK